MASKKATSKSSVASDAYTGPITHSLSKGITQEQDQGSSIAQSILKQLMESHKAGIVLKENSLYDNSDSIMMADITVETAMTEMERKINLLIKLHDMIANSIRAQYGGPPQTSVMYSKSYTKRIDSLRMPLGYQPPKFQQFDGKGNPKQHIAHFVKTCENAG
ncbi:ty3-gypsy retrotransposon protein [Cucumis melo var. makuwa]|uniref:Ty3-gypsy retrotransposon protein n=1 Tax=Cucumis melo var. makuwa TaxID=1194695 RepID=A0A5D3BSE1_CUCMM|nr:ty3-gypsy retrotransposon protein [Cucumis melo var. makuwa]TYK01146.1 ty3-gypsy retrotransposon protein [Cucumis melo var. makuwa]